jgi:Calcineurin-like phosphoesterase
MTLRSLPPSDRPLGRLFNGPLDVIGDVHGEIEALSALLGHLGYAPDGRHPAGHRAVFVGDLCDRGPDSPAVLDLVMGWVLAGRAQCVLGNHELNVLLGEPKHGNGWFFDRNHELSNGEFLHSRAATAERRAAWTGFLERLPLALAREDLRVVHACWDVAALEQLGPPLAAGKSYRDLHAALDAGARERLRGSGTNAQAAREVQAYRHAFKDRAATVPMLPAYAEEATFRQNANLLKLVTSGPEAPSEQPIWAGGRWRMTQRARWWNDYGDPPAVVMGHYWRLDARAQPAEVTGDWDYPLGDYGPYEWMGPRRNVFCIDYSVGGRYAERARGGQPPYQTRLAALRWPDRELVFDDGERRRV